MTYNGEFAAEWTFGMDDVGVHADSCYRRLHGIVGKIQSCDAILRSQKLEPGLLFVAHRLIDTIQAELDRVGRSAARMMHALPESRQIWLAQIEKQLENLTELCDQLVTAMEQPQRAVGAA